VVALTVAMTVKATTSVTEVPTAGYLAPAPALLTTIGSNDVWTLPKLSGSSPTPVAVDLPASKLGRPAVTLRENWIEKGVATAILTALDRKPLILVLLVLLVWALFCLNATSAAVRTRATDLGVLACVGWPARKLFQLLLLAVGIFAVTVLAAV
jgi:hypothetical protein